MSDRSMDIFLLYVTSGATLVCRNCKIMGFSYCSLDEIRDMRGILPLVTKQGLSLLECKP